MQKVVIPLLILVFLVFTSPLAHAGDKRRPQSASGDTITIRLSDFGMVKTRKKDCTRMWQKAKENLKGDAPKKIVFRKGVYHFYPTHCEQRTYFESNTTDVNPRICALLFEGTNNLVIEGNGSTLIFHEQMQPFTFDNCNNVTLRNISIDWEKPLIAQAEVMETTDEYIELAIDPKIYPYRIEEGKLHFVTARRQSNPWQRTMEFERDSFYIVPQTGDRGCLGRGWEEYLAENIIPGIVRLHHQFLRKPKKGNYLILRHAERIHSGIFIQDSKNITIDNVNLYHATGLGILAQFSENLTFRKYRAIQNKQKNRYFGGGDDGIQISNCKGLVTVRECEFAGLMDDPINVHGTSVKITEIQSPTRLICRFMHHQSSGLNWGREGDTIRFIENSGMNSISTGVIASFEPVNTEQFIVTLKEPAPASLEIEDALENLTWAPDLHVVDSHFRNCRARGLLVSTPGKVMIENNIFESSGSAILIAGDANGWFESGSVTDVTIRNNKFTDLCNTSSYQFCEGIISVFPIIPEPEKTNRPFHRNITIEHNEFSLFDYPLLYAKSTENITFSFNLVNRSYRFEPYHSRKHTFTFESCRNISILKNKFSEDLLGRNIRLEKTDPKELQTDLQEDFEILY